jgi:hypothetical protein
MIKETKKLKTQLVTEKHRYCDDCGEKINESVYHSRIHCNICKKDLCSKCIGHKENDGSDYTDYFCKDCWSTGEPYRKKIQEHEDAIDKLNEEWESKCRLNVSGVKLCSCNDGVIDCPGCIDARKENSSDKHFNNCAGCNGSGKVKCGKCNGNGVVKF